MDSSVSISGLLSPDRVVVDLKAKSYEDGVGRLLDRIDAAGLVSDRAEIEALVSAEVASGDLPTLGSRALLAHYRSDAVTDLALAIGVSRSPLKFAPQKAPEAVFLVLIVAPRAAARYYLKTLAGLSRVLRDTTIADALAAATSAELFLAVLEGHDLEISPELTVGDLMSRDFQTVSPETLLSEVVHLMVRHRRRGVPVVGDQGEVLGVVTEVEVLQHFLPQLLSAGAGDPEKAKPQDIEVRDIMQRSVMGLSEDQLVSDVLTTMLSEGTVQFPVVREGRLVGFLSRTDFIKKLLEPSVYKSL